MAPLAWPLRRYLVAPFGPGWRSCDDPPPDRAHVELWLAVQADASAAVEEHAGKEEEEEEEEGDTDALLAFYKAQAGTL